MVWRPKKSRKMLSKDASLLNPPRSQRIHGTGIFPYINHKKQPNVGKYTIHGSYRDSTLRCNVFIQNDPLFSAMPAFSLNEIDCSGRNIMQRPWMYMLWKNKRKQTTQGTQPLNEKNTHSFWYPKMYILHQLIW